MKLTDENELFSNLQGRGLVTMIARKINTDPPSVTRSRKNALKKLTEEVTDLEWATRIDVGISEFNSDIVYWHNQFVQHFYLNRKWKYQ